MAVVTELVAALGIELKKEDAKKISDFEAFKNEIIPLEEFFLQKTGYKLDKFFRPPEGAFNESTLQFAEKLGYTTVFWNKTAD